MSHWAQLDENNVVIQVTVGNNDDPDEGYQWLVDNHGGRWIQTSYNAMMGMRKDPESGLPIPGTKGFRMNYAIVGSVYDEAADAFYMPKEHNGWILNKKTGWWEPPSEDPSNEQQSYYWDEELERWEPYRYQHLY